MVPGVAGSPHLDHSVRVLFGECRQPSVLEDGLGESVIEGPCGIDDMVVAVVRRGLESNDGVVHLDEVRRYVEKHRYLWTVSAAGLEGPGPHRFALADVESEQAASSGVRQRRDRPSDTGVLDVVWDAGPKVRPHGPTNHRVVRDCA